MKVRATLPAGSINREHEPRYKGNGIACGEPLAGVPLSACRSRRAARASRAAADPVPACCPGAVPACCPGAARAWSAVAKDGRRCPEDSVCPAKVYPPAAAAAVADSVAAADWAAAVVVAALAEAEAADGAAEAADASSSFLAHTKAGLDSSGPSNRQC
jgi:hypothetical protein